MRFERRLSRFIQHAYAIRPLRVTHVGVLTPRARAEHANLGQRYGLLGDDGDVLAVNGFERSSLAHVVETIGIRRLRALLVVRARRTVIVIIRDV